MQLLGLLGLLWMLKASPGATGTVSTATSISHVPFPRAEAARAVLSNSPHSRDLAGRPLGVPQLVSSAPGHRENVPMTLVTSSYDTLISETLLTSPVSSNTSTTPTSKFAFKVETTPPTVLVYSATTECVYPTSFTITISHPTSICVTTTQVAFTSSYTPTPVTQKPRVKRLGLVAFASPGDDGDGRPEAFSLVLPLSERARAAGAGEKECQEVRVS
ncbi:mucin-3A [Theropithecus gelada]|uniref:mucin-3A n=1 Tax=Theropithecus gelada TaxID=9565 RepID=UPI000DC173C4|nr:mucin-3A [Theropithecus gelada]